MTAHRFYIDEPRAPGQARVTIGGEEARHAVRVKRLGVGDAVEVLDGRGTIAAARIEGVRRSGGGGAWEVVLALAGERRVEPVTPRVEVWSAPPAGPRLAELIDGLAQAGAASWRPLIADRGGASANLDRARRVAAEACKQSGRAWAMSIEAPASLDEAFAAHEGGDVVLADASGDRYRATGAAGVRLLVGPEGGWTPGELGAARAAGARAVRFGPHVMRIETAAVAACAVVLELEGRA